MKVLTAAVFALTTPLTLAGIFSKKNPPQQLPQYQDPNLPAPPPGYPPLGNHPNPQGYQPIQPNQGYQPIQPNQGYQGHHAGSSSGPNAVSRGLASKLIAAGYAVNAIPGQIFDNSPMYPTVNYANQQPAYPNYGQQYPQQPYYGQQQQQTGALADYFRRKIHSIITKHGLQSFYPNGVEHIVNRLMDPARVNWAEIEKSNSSSD